MEINQDLSPFLFFSYCQIDLFTFKERNESKWPIIILVFLCAAPSVMPKYLDDFCRDVHA